MSAPEHRPVFGIKPIREYADAELEERIRKVRAFLTVMYEIAGERAVHLNELQAEKERRES